MIPSRQRDPVVLKQHETIWILSTFCERWMHSFDGESLVALLLMLLLLLLLLLEPVDFERCGEAAALT
jgi:hypothetical protein